MSTDRPTLSEIADANVRAAIRSDDIRYQILMGNAPKEWIEQTGVAK